MIGIGSSTLFPMSPREAHILLACSMVCNRSCHLPGNTKLSLHPARLIKEGGCVMSMDTMYLKGHLALFGSEGSALTLLLFFFNLE